MKRLGPSSVGRSRFSLPCRAFAASAALLLVLFACSRSRQESKPEAEYRGPNPFATTPDLTTLPGTVCEVKFKPSTVRIEPEKFIHALRSFSPDHTIYIFDKSSETARSLQAGKIFFVPGLTIQKVIATAEDGPDLVVGADEAPLTEAMESATIKWDAPVNFQQIAAQQKRAALPLWEPPGLLARLDSPFTSLAWAAPDEEKEGWSAQEVKGWKHNLSTQPDSGGLGFKLELEKESDDAGVTATIQINGYIQNFRNASSLVIHNGALDSFDLHNYHLTAVVNVVWTVSKSKPGTATGEEDFRLPTSFSVPLVIGGIPFSLELSEAVMFKPGFTSGGELAKAGFKAQMNGDQGFTWSGADATDDSNSSGEGSVQDHKGVAPVAPFAVLIAVSAPRIELSTGPEAAFAKLKGLVPPTLGERLGRVTNLLGLNHAFSQWMADRAREALKAKGAAHVQLISSTSITVGSATALIPCQRTQLVLTGNAGISAQFFKLIKKEYEVNFVRKENVVVFPDIKGCQI